MSQSILLATFDSGSVKDFPAGSGSIRFSGSQIQDDFEVFYQGSTDRDNSYGFEFGPTKTWIRMRNEYS